MARHLNTNKGKDPESSPAELAGLDQELDIYELFTEEERIALGLSSGTRSVPSAEELTFSESAADALPVTERTFPGREENVETPTPVVPIDSFEDDEDNYDEETDDFEEEKPKKEKREKKAKKRGAFGRGVAIYLIILAIICVGVLAVLWHFLTGYQADFEAQKAEEEAEAEAAAQKAAYEEMVREAPQKAFLAWYETTNTDYWVDLWFEIYPDSMDTADSVGKIMAERFDKNAVTTFRASTYTDVAPVYVLKNGETTVSTVTLSGSETEWQVSGSTLELEGTASGSIVVPTGSRVYCNGNELSADYASDSTTWFKYQELADSLIDPVTWETYTVNGLLNEPELTFEFSSEVFALDFKEDGSIGSYICYPKNFEGEEELQEKAVKLVKAYLKYYMSGKSGTDSNLSAVLKLLKKGTQAYSDLKGSKEGVIWNTPYTKIDTSMIAAGPIVYWAENCVSIDVPLNATGKLKGVTGVYSDATMRIYFTDQGDGLIITNFEII